MNNSNGMMQRSVSGRSRLLMAGALSLMVLLVAGAWMVLRGVQEDYQTERKETRLSDFGVVPDVMLTERSGRNVSLGSLRGQIWVADFIFTRCSGTCQIMTVKMRDIQHSLIKAEGVKLVSISVDPKNDTPERLTVFANNYQADREKWLFLTGEESKVQDLAKNSFHLALQEGTSPDEPITHSTRFVLVDRQGHIRGYYNGKEDPEAQAKLLTDIAILTQESQ